MSVLARGTVLLPIVSGVSCFTRDRRTWLGTVEFLPKRMLARRANGTQEEFYEFGTALDWLKDQQ